MPNTKAYRVGTLVGKVLQVVGATYGTSTTVASTTLTDIGLSASITPSSTSSKILVTVSLAMQSSRAANTASGRIAILRGSTVIWDGTDFSNGGSIGGASSVELSHNVTFSYLDSPSSTSSLTYKLQGATWQTTNSGLSRFFANNQIGQLLLQEIGA